MNHTSNAKIWTSKSAYLDFHWCCLNNHTKTSSALQIGGGSKMLNARRRGKLWLLFGACAGLVLALAHESVSGLIYAGAQATPGRAAERTPVTIDRAPQRAIKDQYPSFSAVAIDPEENMLVVTDENLFQFLEYDRRENTPPRARLTEPKRVISGPNTRAEMLCGVYIDPVTKEVYVLNNDTQNWLPVFSRDARCNATPSRYLAAPHGTFGIAVDEEKQEMFLTVQHQNSIVVYRKQASGEEKPLRTIAGSDTQLEEPHGIALDIKNGEVSVASMGSHAVLFFPVTADGDVKPSRIIRGGPSGQIALNIGNPGAVGYDTKRDQILVPN